MSDRYAVMILEYSRTANLTFAVTTIISTEVSEANEVEKSIRSRTIFWGYNLAAVRLDPSTSLGMMSRWSSKRHFVAKIRDRIE